MTCLVHIKFPVFQADSLYWLTNWGSSMEESTSHTLNIPQLPVAVCLGPRSWSFPWPILACPLTCFICVCVCFTCMYTCAPYVCLCPWNSEEGIASLGNGVKGGGEATCAHNQWTVSSAQWTISSAPHCQYLNTYHLCSILASQVFSPSFHFNSSVSSSLQGRKRS